MHVCSEVEGHLSFVEELLAGFGHFVAGELVDCKSIDNLPLAVDDLHGEAVVNSLGDTVFVAV